jgi:hypothetical protein
VLQTRFESLYPVISSRDHASGWLGDGPTFRWSKQLEEESEMKRTIIAVSMLAVVASTTCGSLYFWNANKRPPVALQEALRRADKLLGDDAKNRYCIGVMLYGNKKGDGKFGIWNLQYCTEDGPVKMVYIDSQTGKGHVELWKGSIDLFKKVGRRTGLKDIATRLNKVLKDFGYTERAAVTKNKLVLRARTRKYQVHPYIEGGFGENGGFGEDLVEVIGPKHDGVIIEAFESGNAGGEPPFFSSHDLGKYWQSNRSNHLLTGKNRYVTVDIRYGEKRKRGIGQSSDLLGLLMRAFGEQRGL